MKAPHGDGIGLFSKADDYSSCIDKAHSMNFNIFYIKTTYFMFL